MSEFNSVYLPSLPLPSIIETIDYETIFSEMLADLQGRDTAFDALVESDPAYKILELAAYREVILRQRINENTKSVMLAYAAGPQLDQIGANYDVLRLVIDAGDENAIPPIEPTLESDEAFRNRILLSFEGYSVAGPRGAYIFHALSADADVKSVGVKSDTPGVVLVTVLSNQGDGTADAALLQVVTDKLNDEDVRPLADNVTVQSATIVNYSIDATLTIQSGPDSSVVLAEANNQVSQFIEKYRAVGVAVPISGIYAALHVEGVTNVSLTSPASDVAITDEQAAYCTGVTIA